MLTLGRKIGEEIVIGDNIVIQVLDIRGSREVRLGITAPPEVRIDRAERRQETPALPPPAPGRSEGPPRE